MTQTQIILEIPWVTTRPEYNKIGVIKAIRGITGLGLKEAKDASEMSGVQLLPCYGVPNDQLYEEHCRYLRSMGVRVGDPVLQILDELRALGSRALLSGEDDLANEILQLVLVGKLRRKPPEVNT